MKSWGELGGCWWTVARASEPGAAPVGRPRRSCSMIARPTSLLVALGGLRDYPAGVWALRGMTRLASNWQARFIRMSRIPPCARPPGPRRRARIVVSALTLVALLSAGLAAFAAVKVKDLPIRYQEWLEDVSYLIHKKERKQFLLLEKDYQRDAFIGRFWASRDPDPATPDNRFRSYYLARLEEARERYDSPYDDRRRVYVLNGDPTSVFETDCKGLFWPLQVWRYSYSAHTGGELMLILYQRGTAAPYRILSPSQPRESLVQIVTSKSFVELIYEECTINREEAEKLLYMFQTYDLHGPTAVSDAIAPPNLDPEWLTTFRAHSTEIDSDTRRFEPTLSIDYPGPHKQRVIVRNLVEVPREEAKVIDLNGRRSYNFALLGEVLKDEVLFDSFKYVFDVPGRRPRRRRRPDRFRALAPTRRLSTDRQDRGSPWRCGRQGRAGDHRPQALGARRDLANRDLRRPGRRRCRRQRPGVSRACSRRQGSPTRLCSVHRTGRRRRRGEGPAFFWKIGPS